MIKFEGDRVVSRPVEEVSAKLADAGWLVGTLKDAEVTQATPQRAVWKMRPGFSFIRTTLETTAEVIENVPGTSTRYRLVSSGIGATSTVEVAVTYAARDGGTAVHWVAEVMQLTGLLKLVPRGLIQSAAGKVVEETWAGVEAKLAG